MAHRTTDTTEVRTFQTDRFFESNGQWYFVTREKADQGPFVTRDLAQYELSVYLRTFVGIPQDAWDRPGGAR